MIADFRGRQLRPSLLALTMVCSVGLHGCKKAADETPAVAVSVKAEHPETGIIAEQITSDAVLAPLAQAALAPKISAPVRTFYVQRGSRVKKGQLLAVLEDRDLQGAAIDSKGSLLSAEAAYATATRAQIPEDLQKAQLDVAQAKANLDLANRTSEDRKRLLKEGAISGREADTSAAAAVQAQAAYDIAANRLHGVQTVIRQASTETAQGQLTSAKGKYVSAEAQVAYANLRSPINGIVTDRSLFAGETAAAGAPVVTVMDTSSLLAKLHLAQASAQKLKLGGPAEVRVPGVDAPVTATVSLISPALDPGSTTVEVWLKLPNQDGSLKVGTAVRAAITGTTVNNALKIPLAALLPSQDSSASVMVVGSDGAAHKRVVKTGIRTGDDVQITDGLTVADNVITEGSYGLDEGTKVKLGAGDEEKPAADDTKPAAGKATAAGKN